MSRDDCTLLLDCQQPEKAGRGRMFISIESEPFQSLRSEFEGRGRRSGTD